MPGILKLQLRKDSFCWYAKFENGIISLRKDSFCWYARFENGIISDLVFCHIDIGTRGNSRKKIVGDLQRGAEKEE